MQVQTLQYDGGVWAGPFPEDDSFRTLTVIGERS